jgi:hypothetical protein
MADIHLGFGIVATERYGYRVFKMLKRFEANDFRGKVAMIEGVFQDGEQEPAELSATWFVAVHDTLHEAETSCLRARSVEVQLRKPWQMAIEHAQRLEEHMRTETIKAARGE